MQKQEKVNENHFPIYFLIWHAPKKEAVELAFKNFNKKKFATQVKNIFRFTHHLSIFFLNKKIKKIKKFLFCILLCASKRIVCIFLVFWLYTIINVNMLSPFDSMMLSNNEYIDANHSLVEWYKFILKIEGSRFLYFY